jgi:hypothetical protein
MSKLVNFLNNRVFIAVIVGLFLLGFAKKLFGR